MPFRTTLSKPLQTIRALSTPNGTCKRVPCGIAASRSRAIGPKMPQTLIAARFLKLNDAGGRRKFPGNRGIVDPFEEQPEGT
jgi:hypothetical protein